MGGKLRPRRPPWASIPSRKLAKTKVDARQQHTAAAPRVFEGKAHELK